MTLLPAGMRASQAKREFTGLVLDQRYRLLEPLGHGAYGCVYRACCLDSWRDEVAIKVLNPKRARVPEVVARFYREASMASRCGPAATVAVREVGKSEGLFYIVMELAQGSSLTSLIDREFPLPMPDVLSIMTSLLAGMESIHTAGIIHADIKSDNIMVRETIDGVQATIIDFGLSHERGPPVLPSKMAVDNATDGLIGIHGTPGYMAPEVILGGKSTHACDIYAAGIVFYQLLTGRMPFKGLNTLDTLRRQLNQPLTPPSRIATAIPVSATVEAVLLRATARDPQRRFRTIADFRRALEMDERPRAPLSPAIDAQRVACL